MKNFLHTSANEKAILVPCDDNFVEGLIALLNSIIRNIPDAKIYLVHELSSKNINHIKDYIYKSQRFDASFWKHLSYQKDPFHSQQEETFKRISFAKYQVEFLETSHFLCVDADVIVNKPIKWETPATLTCDVKRHSLNLDDWPKGPVPESIKGYYNMFELLKQFVLSEGGLAEKEKKITAYFPGAFFANKDWIINTLRPEIYKCSTKYQSSAFYEFEYFNAAIGILRRPVKSWKLKQAFPYLAFLKDIPKKDLELMLGKIIPVLNCDLIHFMVSKPWNCKQGDYPFPGGDAWWDYYLGGPIKPIDA
jgi:hypothetical protein